MSPSNINVLEERLKTMTELYQSVVKNLEAINIKLDEQERRRISEIKELDQVYIRKSEFDLTVDNMQNEAKKYYKIIDGIIWFVIIAVVGAVVGMVVSVGASTHKETSAIHVRNQYLSDSYEQSHEKS